MLDSIEFLDGSCLRRPQNLLLTPARIKNVAGRPMAFLGFPGLMSGKSRGLFCRALDAKAVEGEVFSVTSSSKSDVDYLGESTKGDLNVKQEHLEAFGEFRTVKLIFFWICFPL